MKIIKYLFILFLGAILSVACRKIEQISPIPSIRFESFSIFDTTDILGNQLKGGKLEFYFEDGDGDIGIESPSGLGNDTTNLFLTLYRKTNGEMVPAEEGDPLYPSSYRIPYMERLGQNKILSGTITVTFMYLFYSPTDTVMYDFYIRDRAMHDSNVASTSEIIISENNIYQ
jgi:hypothetical protein